MQAVSANLFGVMTPWEAAATMIPGPYGSPVATYLVEQIQRRSEAEVRILCAILLATKIMRPAAPGAAAQKKRARKSKAPPKTGEEDYQPAFTAPEAQARYSWRRVG